MSQLAYIYRRLGRADESNTTCEQVFDLAKARFGDQHKVTQNARNDLAFACLAGGNYARALSLTDEMARRTLAERGADHADAVEMLDRLTQRYLEVAVLQAWFGKDADLAATVERMFHFVRGTKEDVALERTAKACCLLKAADTQQRAEALAMARQAVAVAKEVRFRHCFVMAVGMAEYRSGLFAEAAATMADAAKLAADDDDRNVIVPAGLFGAMSLHQLGNTEEARAVANKAVAGMKKPLPADETKAYSGDNSIDDLVVWMVYKEAKSLIGFDAVPAAAAPETK